MPKTSLIISAIVSLLLSELYHFAVPSSESQQISDSGNELKEHVDVAAELAAEIENLNIVFAFQSQVKADTNHEPILIRLTKISGPRYIAFEVLGNAMDAANASGKRFWGFSFQARSIDTNSQNSKGWNGYHLARIFHEG